MEEGRIAARLREGQAEFVLSTRAALWRLLRAIQECFAVHGPADLGGLRFGFFGCFGYDIIHAIDCPLALDFSDDSCLALCIRTAAYRAGCYTIRASAGVVADSLPEQEWAETIAKLGAPYWAICGTELTP